MSNNLCVNLYTRVFLIEQQTQKYFVSPCSSMRIKIEKFRTKNIPFYFLLKFRNEGSVVQTTSPGHKRSSPLLQRYETKIKTKKILNGFASRCFYEKSIDSVSSKVKKQKNVNEKNKCVGRVQPLLKKIQITRSL